jgi:hypothetical protein
MLLRSKHNSATSAVLLFTFVLFSLVTAKDKTTSIVESLFNEQDHGWTIEGLDSGTEQESNLIAKVRCLQTLFAWLLATDPKLQEFRM